jgi:hypothetical protein
MKKYCFVNLNEIGRERIAIEVLYNCIDTEQLTENQCVDLAFTLKRAVHEAFDAWRESHNQDTDMESERTVHGGLGKNGITLTLIETKKKP